MTLVLIVALVTGAILFGVGVYGALSQTNLAFSAPRKLLRPDVRAGGDDRHGG